MVSRTGAGPGLYAPPLRNIQPVNIVQKITAVVLSILCFTVLPLGWNIAGGLGVLALGLLYPLRGRVMATSNIFQAPPPPIYLPPYIHVPVFPVQLRDPRPAVSHQMGERHIPGSRGFQPPAPQAPSFAPSYPSTMPYLQAPVFAPPRAAGHQMGERHIPGSRGFQPPVPSVSMPGVSQDGHQIGARHLVGGE